MAKRHTRGFTSQSAGRVSLNAGFTPHTAGFMIIELLISVVIMSVMSTIVLSANSTMSARLETDNLAHLVALTIREAQVRSLSATVPVGAATAPGYGVYFDRVNGNTLVTPFFDPPTTEGGNNTYSGDSEMVGTPNALGRGYTIDAIGVRMPSGDISIERMSILFRRPRPDAIIGYGTGGGGITATDGTQATIRIRSSKAGISKTITVTSTGQISVQ